MKAIRKSFDELEKTVTDTTQKVIKKFMSDREKINEAFDKDPHQTSEIANRIQASKLKLDLQNKADKFELENLNMSKANRTDLNVLTEKIASIQSENSQLIFLFNESIKMHIDQAKGTKKQNRLKEIMSQLHTIALRTQKPNMPNFNGSSQMDPFLGVDSVDDLNSV